MPFTQWGPCGAPSPGVHLGSISPGPRGLWPEQRSRQCLSRASDASGLRPSASELWCFSDGYERINHQKNIEKYRILIWILHEYYIIEEYYLVSTIMNTIMNTVYMNTNEYGWIHIEYTWILAMNTNEYTWIRTLLMIITITSQYHDRQSCLQRKPSLCTSLCYIASLQYFCTKF